MNIIVGLRFAKSRSLLCKNSSRSLTANFDRKIYLHCGQTLFILLLCYKLCFPQHKIEILNAANYPLIEGVWNPIRVLPEKCNCDSIMISTNRGALMRDSLCAYKIKPAGLQNHTVYLRNLGDTVIIDSITFTVRPLRIDDVIVFPNKRNRCIIGFKSIDLDSEDIVNLKLPYTIDGFSVSIINTSGEWICTSFWNEGNTFGKEILECVSRLSLKPKRGKTRMGYTLIIQTIRFTIDDEVFFRNINAYWHFPCVH
jgi:hypothetical protein